MNQDEEVNHDDEIKTNGAEINGAESSDDAQEILKKGMSPKRKTVQQGMFIALKCLVLVDQIQIAYSPHARTHALLPLILFVTSW